MQAGHRNKGRGFTLIELMIVIAIIAIIAAIAIPNLLHARKSANETAAVGALKTITTSQSVFREGDKEQDGNLDYGMMSELSNVGLLDSVLGKGSKQGYYFSCAYSQSTSEFLWFATANPQVATSSGDRYFETNTAGVIFYTTNQNLSLDTSSCSLTQSTIPGITPVGK
jgi:prepilin-type N-terminal cleavage/methylation domain-containing protein